MYYRGPGGPHRKRHLIKELDAALDIGHVCQESLCALVSNYIPSIKILQRLMELYSIVNLHLVLGSSDPQCSTRRAQFAASCSDSDCRREGRPPSRLRQHWLEE